MTERVLSWDDRCLGLALTGEPAPFQRRRRLARESIGEDWTVTIKPVPAAHSRVALSRGGSLRVSRVYGTDYPTPDRTAIRDDVHVIDLPEAHTGAGVSRGWRRDHRATVHRLGLVGPGVLERPNGPSGDRSAVRWLPSYRTLACLADTALSREVLG